MLSDTTGYVHNFEICTGVADTVLLNEPNLSAAKNVVMRLHLVIKDGKNHKLYYDNYYSDIPLVVYLFHRDIQVSGIINKNHILILLFLLNKKLKKNKNERNGTKILIQKKS